MNSANLLELLNALLNSSWYFARSNGQLEPYCKYFRSSTDSSFNERFKANLFFRVEPKLSEDMLLPRWSSILLCFPLCMIYFRHSSKLQNSFIILKQFWSYCQNRDLKKTGTPNFLLTGGIALRATSGRETSVFHDLVLLETWHQRPKCQTQWKHLIFLAPMVGVQMTLILYLAIWTLTFIASQQTL